MRVAHIALWTLNVERLANFWERVFQAHVGKPYESLNRPGFRSRFITLREGPSIELMTGPWIKAENQIERLGYAHLAISVGSRDAVDDLAMKMKSEGALLSGPRMTGDGFYEATIRDPDGNTIEVTV